MLWFLRQMIITALLLCLTPTLARKLCLVHTSLLTKLRKCLLTKNIELFPPFCWPLVLEVLIYQLLSCIITWCCMYTLWYGRGLRLFPYRRKAPNHVLKIIEQISILNSVSNILEKFVCNNIYGVIFCRISLTQHGFYLELSPIFKLCSKWDGQRKPSWRGLHRFLKSFRTMNLDILLHKLAILGITGTDFVGYIVLDPSLSSCGSRRI